MRLRELFPQAPADPEVTSLAYDGRQRAARRAVLLRARLHPRRARLRARGDRQRRRRARRRPPARPRRARGAVVEDVRAAMAPAAARLHGDPSARLDVVGITGTSGKTTTAFLVRELLEGAGRQHRAAGDREERRRRPRGDPRAHDAGGRRPPGRVRRDGRRRRRRLRDGGLQPRAGAAPRGRDPLGRRGVHEPQPGPPRLPPDDGGVLPRQAPALRGRSAGGDRQRRRRLGRAPGRRDGRHDGVRRGRRRRARRRRAPGPRGHGLRRRRPRGHAAGRCAPRCAGASTSPTRSRPSSSPARSASTTPPSRRRCARAAPVPGRLEPVEEGQGFAVLVDYAHKPGALESVLDAARDLTRGRVIVVFGAGGDRDRGKRPIMGEVAGRLADEVVITSDNPRSEDPDAIVAEIVAGVGRRDVRVEPDRRAAIELAVSLARDGDVAARRRQGPRAGPGARGRPRRSRSTTSRSRGRPCVRAWSPEPRRGGRGRADPVPARPDRRSRSPARDDRLPRRPPGGPLRRAARRARRRGQLRGGRAGRGRLGRARRPRPRGRRRPRPGARRTRWPRCRRSRSPGAASSAPRSSASPARPARPPRRTSSPRWSRPAGG